MKEMKLIAIRPLKGCDKKFLKILKEGEVYQFYQDYQFIRQSSTDVNSKIVNVEFNPTIPSDLYNAGDLSINISAVLGKNGSGKSSLFELYFAFCYSLAIKYKIINDEEYIKNLLDNNPSSYYEELLKEIRQIIDNVKVEVYYLIDGIIHVIINDGGDHTNYKLIESKWTLENNIFEDYFYSIIVNYSLYGLNSINSVWLNSLFHKNDGYQTPIVINPYREEGNIDVNSEFHLAQSRVLANLSKIDLENPDILKGKSITLIDYIIYPSDISNLNGVSLKNVFDLYNQEQHESVLIFFNKISKALAGFELPDALLATLNKIMLIELSQDETKDLFDDSTDEIEYIDILYILVKYTIKKIFKICIRYKEYTVKFYADLNKDRPIPHLKNITELIDKLKSDGSHITLKLRQILFSIKEDYFNDRWSVKRSILDPKRKAYHFSMDMNSFKTKITSAIVNNNKISKEIVDLIPVACVKPTLIVRNSLSKNSDSSFQYLSSGELQLIHTLHTIYYHINNINSVFSSIDRNKIKYSKINIMLDEVELYFHPEFQRRFINELLEGIMKLVIPEINGINILFATHSPFILSDIPSVNILRLDEGVPILFEMFEDSFGANIYDLLDNDFFMKAGFIGEFAMTKIKAVLDYVKENDYNEEKHNYFLRIVNLIGDTVIRIKLTQLLSNLVPEKIENKQKEILDLIEKKKEIEDQLTKLGEL